MIKELTDLEFNELVGLLGQIVGKRNADVMAQVMTLLEKVENRSDF